VQLKSENLPQVAFIYRLVDSLEKATSAINAGRSLLPKQVTRPDKEKPNKKQNTTNNS